MDLVSIEEAEEYIGLDSGTGGSFLTDTISQVSLTMARFTGRTDWGGSSSRTEYHHGGTSWITPRYWPISSVTSISDDPQHDWAASSVIDSADYYVSTEDDGFIWIESGMTTTGGRRSVKLVYTGGYANEGAVPGDLKLSAKIQIKHEWDIIRRPGRGEASEVGAGELMPQVLKTLVQHTRRVPFG